jgi:predicted aspartyl protease
LLISEDYPYLEVKFVVKDYQAQARAYLDTGFDGYLVVPLSLAANLGSEDYVTRWEMGDGSLVEVKEYLGSIEVSNLGLSFPARIILLSNDFVLGRGVIDQLRVTFDHGRRIEIES